ncbi:MAG: hypothetical protein NTW87_00115 [Planctomycetota bacterium]|nr:hypothetical protein [Planctomycetota bacterium]
MAVPAWIANGRYAGLCAHDIADPANPAVGPTPTTAMRCFLGDTRERPSPTCPPPVRSGGTIIKPPVIGLDMTIPSSPGPVIGLGDPALDILIAPPR